MIKNVMNWKAWREMIPRSGSAIVGLGLVAVAAFVLGGFLFGNGDPSEERRGTADAHVSETPSEATTWTCSMHPHIQLPKPGKCPICYMDLIPLRRDTGDDLGPAQIRLSERAKNLARIRTTAVRRAFADREVRMVGRIAYDESRVAFITARVPGRLDHLYADFTGMTVKRGDHMVSIYSPELLATQEELLQARAAVEALQRSTSRVLQTTADATLESAREKLRLHGLTERQVSGIETSGKTSDHLTIYAPIGGVVVHKEALEGMYVQTGTQIYTIADLSQLWVLFEAYESDLPWLRYGQGVTFTTQSFPGEEFEAVISFLDPVVDPSTRTVKVRAIVENGGRRLKPDMFVRGVVRSRVDGRGNVIDKDLAGKWISPMHPEVVKNGPGKCDVCGMPLVRAESLGYAPRKISEEDAPLLIPATAPLITGKRAVVYVEIPDPAGPLFEGRVVQLGPRAGDFYVVSSGLEEGELVVTHGAFKIDSELQIQAKPSMMSPVEPAAPADLHQKESEIGGALAPVYGAYLSIGKALADDDMSGAVGRYRQLLDSLRGVDMSLFVGSAHDRWMNSSRELNLSARRGAAAESIEAARIAFYDLSNGMIDLHTSFGHGGDTPLYLVFCPMARDNEGAYWLQDNETVSNSYYGSEMLRCGEIKKTFPPEGKETE
jgi:Cu(I)/Ag(I) efflux system membrane fusion protein